MTNPNRETPAEHLARLRAAYPAWRIDSHTQEAASGPGSTSYTARHREADRTLTADTPAVLEAMLIQTEPHDA